MIQFEWNERQAVQNFRKHGVSFLEAKTVFYDEYARQFFDDGHSADEDRFLMLGRSGSGRLLILAHCVRESETVIRIVSARKATRVESSYYQGPVE